MERIEQKESDIIRVTNCSRQKDINKIVIIQGGKFNRDEIIVEKSSIPALIAALQKHIE